MDFRRLVAVGRAWLPLIVAVPLVAAITAFVVSSFQPKVYEGKATLIVGQSLSAANPDYTQLLVAQGLSDTYAAIAKTRPILERVIAEVGLPDTPLTLSNRVQVDAPRETSFLIIRAKDEDPGRAAAIANELGGQLIAASPAIQGQSDLQESVDKDLVAIRSLIDSTQTRYEALIEADDRTAQQESELSALEDRLVSLRSTYATLVTYSSGGASNTLSVVEPAAAPIAPVSPTTLLNTLFAAALGLLIVTGIAFLAEQLDDSIRDPEAVREVANLNNLGTITQIRIDRSRSAIYRVVTLLYPQSSLAEGYRGLRVNIEFASVDAPLRTLLVTSAAPNEGKTMTASNLAVAFAQAGRKVLLVDADLRRPGVHEYFNLPNTDGLTTVLRDTKVDLEVVSHPTEQAGLRVVTSGPLPPNPAELLGSQRMQAVLGLLRNEADLVLFDSPPLQAVADSAVLSAFVDGTLLVIDAGRSRRRQVRMAREALSRAGATVLGAVLNRVAEKETLQYGYRGTSDAEAEGRPLVPTGTPDHSSQSRT